jgi:hypothetical protein
MSSADHCVPDGDHQRSLDYCLVMTACIDPRGANAQLARSDPRQRLNDYLSAIAFWLAYEDPRLTGILFLDNSEHDLAEIRAALDPSRNPFGRDVEILRAGTNHIPSGIGYGYAELGMLDYASKASRLWRSASRLVKVTGRLVFPSLRQLMLKTPDSVQLLVDARSHARFWHKNVGTAGGGLQVQVFMFTPEFYDQHLYDHRRVMKPVPGHRLIENTLFRELYPLHQKVPNEVRFRFPCNCSPRGRTGIWDSDYRAPRVLLKNAVRAVVRHVAPWCWI